MMLLDTNIVSEVMKPSPSGALVSFLDAQPDSALFVSTITRGEIELGICLLPEGTRKQALRRTADAVLPLFSGQWLGFGEQAAVEYGALVASRTRLGRPISVEDAQIAAIAIVHGMQLVTRNQRDFEQITDLVTINPWAE